MDTSPAVVALLHGGRSWRHLAVTATVLDLAARGSVQVEAIDDPWPGVTATRLGATRDAFEVACVRRLRELPGPTPWSEVGTWGRRSGWARGFETSVVRRAKEDGLLTRHVPSSRLTAAGGRERDAWRGAACHLADLDPFRDEPPASVAYWGRSIAFAEALGFGPRSVGSASTTPVATVADAMGTVAARAALRLASFRTTPRPGGPSETWWYVHAGGDRAVVHRELRSVEGRLPSPLLEAGTSLADLGDDAVWAAERSKLVTHQGDRVVVVVAELDHFTGDERLEVARALAGAALGR